MLNFTGDTKRRNINLGSKSRTSKRDLLIKAERERTRRAEERRDNEAAIKIQKYIRKRLEIRNFFQNEYIEFSKNLMNDIPGKDIHLFPVFGVHLLEYIPLEHLKRLLTKYKDYYCNYPNELINTRAMNLLSKYCKPDILKECLSLINFQTLKDELIILEGLFKFIQTNQTFNFLTHDYIYDFFNSMLEESSLFAYMNTMSLLCTYSLDSYFENESMNSLITVLAKLKILPHIEPTMNQVALQTYFHHLCYLHTLTEIDQEYIESILLELMKSFREYNESSTRTFQSMNIILLFQSTFPQKLINEVMNDNLPMSAITLLLQMSESANISYNNELLVLCLANKPLCTKAFDSLFEYRTRDEIVSSGMNYLKLCIELLNFHLTLTNDSELFRVQSNIAIPTIKRFVLLLKQFIFEEIWTVRIMERNHDLKKCIDLLTKIYVRDSRIHFCSNKEDTKFWTINDENFQRTTIYKLLDEYNILFKGKIQFDSLYSDHTQFISEQNKTVKNELIEQIINDWHQRNIPEKLIKKFEILTQVPFFINFNDRIEIFYMLINLDRQDLGIDNNNNRSMMNAFMTQGGSNKWTATISRDNILEDAMVAYDNKGEDFKSGIQVKFINEFGPEEGIDGGGVTKEFLTSVANEGFKDSKYDLFLENDQYQIFPKPTHDSIKLKQLSFLGKIVGKCLYEHILIDIDFAPFFLKKILNYSNSFTSTFDDLASLDNTLYKNLAKLAKMTDPDMINSLDLTFEINDSNNPGKTIELITNGSSIKVTSKTLLKYVFMIAKYKLDTSLYSAVTAFNNGLSVMIPPIWLEMFNPEELEMLISGGKKDFNIRELKSNTEYGGYESNDITIKLFWEIIEEMSSEERCDFLKFVTSVPKAPLQGFTTLDPKFGIRNAGEDVTRLPTASTCVNLLKLPNYKDKKIMKDKLLYSIHSGARFDLS